jgi:hypothetical protein
MVRVLHKGVRPRRNVNVSNTISVILLLYISHQSKFQVDARIDLVAEGTKVSPLFGRRSITHDRHDNAPVGQYTHCMIKRGPTYAYANDSPLRSSLVIHRYAVWYMWVGNLVRGFPSVTRNGRHVVSQVRSLYKYLVWHCMWNSCSMYNLEMMCFLVFIFASVDKFPSHPGSRISGPTLGMGTCICVHACVWWVVCVCVSVCVCVCVCVCTCVSL